LNLSRHFDIRLQLINITCLVNTVLFLRVSRHKQLFSAVLFAQGESIKISQTYIHVDEIFGVLPSNMAVFHFWKISTSPRNYGRDKDSRFSVRWIFVPFLFLRISAPRALVPTLLTEIQHDYLLVFSALQHFWTTYFRTSVTKSRSIQQGSVN
jgi:hypothetical protein